MNILKIYPVILALLVVKSECGLVDSVFGTIKNTTIAIRADIHNIVAYGNDLVFGGKEKPTEVDSSQKAVEPKTEGLFTNLYHRSVNAVHDFRQRVSNMFAKDENPRPHKGIITKVVDSVNKKLKGIQDYFDTMAVRNEILEIPGNSTRPDFFDDDSKAVRDEILNVLFRNNTNVLNKLTISETEINEIFKGLNGTVNEKLTYPTNTKGKEDGYVNIDVRSLADNLTDKL